VNQRATHAGESFGLSDPRRGRYIKSAGPAESPPSGTSGPEMSPLTKAKADSAKIDEMGR